MPLPPGQIQGAARPASLAKALPPPAGATPLAAKAPEMAARVTPVVLAEALVAQRPDFWHAERSRRLAARMVRLLVFFCLPALGLAAAGIVLIGEMRSVGVVVMPFGVPTSFAARGYTPEAMARALAAQIDGVRRATLADRTDRRPSELSLDLPAFERPAPAASLHGLAILMRDIVGPPVRRLAGNVALRSDGQAVLTLHLTRAGAFASTEGFTPEETDARLAAVAPEVWRVVSPKLYAWWLAAHEDRQDELRRRLLDLQSESLDPPTADTVALLAGRTLLRSGRPAEALAEATALNERSPAYPSAWQLRAMTLAELGRPEEAIEAIRRARAADGGFAWSMKATARLMLRLGRGTDALNEIRGARRLDPTDSDAMVIEVAALLATGNGPEALNAARTLVERAPLQPGSGEALASALLASGRPDLALPAVERELTHLRPTASALTLRARLLLAQGRHADALAAADEALRVAPDAAPLLITRAWALLELGRAGEALPIFEAMMKDRPDIVPLVYGRGLALAALGRRSDALAMLERAATMAPENARLHA
ncbi:MAG TPA: tetratricopeptide repeat protein, partial [Acetobacteraceae bacterium]